MIKTLACVTFGVLAACGVMAQEKLVPLRANHQVQVHRVGVVPGQLRSESATLPFFDDFSYPGPFPNPANWTDSEVYVNTGSGWLPPTIGVATFDGLNGQGIPYGTNGYGYADSLTSQPLDLSSLNPGDSVYLSFFYQPQGFGFAPSAADSLILFFLDDDGNWDEQWSVSGDTLVPFAQVMIPVTDTPFFYSGFQFRFANEADFGQDDNWNIDYVRMAAGRSSTDTLLNDVAIASPPSGMLKNYTQMPWRQFAANEQGELASSLGVGVNNGWPEEQNVACSLTATETVSGTLLYAGPPVPASLTALQQQDTLPFPMFSLSYSPPNPLDSVNIAMEYELTTPPTDSKENDTVVQNQVFGNAFAYDDGSAELGYELIGMGSELAYDFTLDRPDTLSAVQINYVQEGGQLTGDLFSIMVWKGINLSGTSAPDTLLGEQNFLEPGFVDSLNGFWTYQLDSPIVLPAGKFYVGTYQLYDNGVYIGFDANNNSQGHLHYKIPTSANWWPSQYTGALMIRPVFGRDTAANNIPLAGDTAVNFNIYPNPTPGPLYVQMGSYAGIAYAITDMSGRNVLEGVLTQAPLNLAYLPGGVYLLTIYEPNSEILESVKFVKL